MAVATRIRFERDLELHACCARFEVTSGASASASFAYHRCRKVPARVERQPFARGLVEWACSLLAWQRHRGVLGPAPGSALEVRYEHFAEDLAGLETALGLPGVCAARDRERIQDPKARTPSKFPKTRRRPFRMVCCA